MTNLTCTVQSAQLPVERGKPSRVHQTTLGANPALCYYQANPPLLPSVKPKRLATILSRKLKSL